MKRIFIALTAVALLFVGCEKEKEPYQNPYRIIVDYLPQTITINGISGAVTPDGDYDWITSNGNGSFTVRRNTTGLIRRAEFTIAGKSDKAIVNQRAHGLDGMVSSSMTNKDADAQTADMAIKFATEFSDDYESWGYVFGTNQDRAANKDYPQGKFSLDDKAVNLTGVDPEVNYYFWAYMVSTEGDKIYSPVFGIAKPVTVKAGEDVQAVYNAAPQFAEVRVEGGVVIDGPFFLRDNVKLSGGWNSTFEKQDLNNRTIIDGGNKRRALVSGITATGDRPGFKNACVNGFEIRNGLGSNVVFNGKLTIEWCYIHNGMNTDKGGGVMATEASGDELILANSIIAWNKADAHAGGVSVSGAGTKVTVVNTLFQGNASIAQYGYTAAIHGQAGVQAYVANCTFVDNVNWRDGSSATSTPWSCIMFRNGGTHIEFVNNLVAGNWYFLPGVASDPDGHPDRYDMPIKPMYILEQQVQQCDMNVMGGDDPNWVFQSNVICGADANNFIGRAGNGAAQNAAQAACTFVHNSNFKTLFKNYDAADFHPAGAALTTGENTSAAKNILGTYMTDLDGNPRITNGKINAGCYQAQ